MSLKFLIVIAGPTAVGKTNLAIQLAKEYSAHIISADSRQFFREMRIGTARPSEKEMQGIKHYFSGFLSIHDNYNVGKFEEESIKLLDELFLKHNLVIMTGGSGLYIDAVCRGFDPLPEANQEIREELNQLYKKEGIASLQYSLQEKDPVYFEKVDKNNPQRLIRAIEVCLLSGKPYSSFLKAKHKKRNFQTILLGLNTKREVLYKNINERVDNMMEQGLLEEVKSLYSHRHLNALQTVGYKELFDFLDAEMDLQSAVDGIKQNTRRFAKRQLTWFRKNKEISWFEPTQMQEMKLHIEKTINFHQSIK